MIDPLEAVASQPEAVILHFLGGGFHNLPINMSQLLIGPSEVWILLVMVKV